MHSKILLIKPQEPKHSFESFLLIDVKYIHIFNFLKENNNEGSNEK